MCKYNPTASCYGLMPQIIHITPGEFIFIAQNINVILVLLVSSIETKMSYGFETHQREKYKCELRLN